MIDDTAECPGRPGFRPKHPGVILGAAIAAVGISKATFASHIGVSRQSIYEILNGERAVTADMAGRLGKALGNDARFWLNLQVAHDTWEINRRPETARIEQLSITHR